MYRKFPIPKKKKRIYTPVKRQATTYLEWDIATKLTEQLVNDQNYTMAILFKLGTNLGLRYSDLSTLKWEDIAKTTISLKEKKTAKNRVLLINEDTKNFVLELRKLLIPGKSRDEDYIFRSRNENKPVCIQHINNQLYDIEEKYNVHIPLSTHVLRKTFGRRVYDLNPTEKTLMLLADVFNHTSISVTKRYLGIRQEEILEVYKSINKEYQFNV